MYFSSFICDLLIFIALFHPLHLLKGTIHSEIFNLELCHDDSVTRDIHLGFWLQWFPLAFCIFFSLTIIGSFAFRDNFLSLVQEIAITLVSSSTLSCWLTGGLRLYRQTFGPQSLGSFLLGCTTNRRGWHLGWFSLSIPLYPFELLENKKGTRELPYET